MLIERKKKTTTRCGIREIATTRNFALWKLTVNRMRVSDWKSLENSERESDLILPKLTEPNLT